MNVSAMIVVDSSALVAIFREEPETDLFLEYIALTERCLLSSISLLEVSMVLAGRHGRETVWKELDHFIRAADMDIVPFSPEQAFLARKAFIHFGKGRHPAALNFGDCASYALAKEQQLPLLFKGDDFTHTDIQAAISPASSTKKRTTP